ncbi:undecaprenyldiphospho-muramoylpentapeptide beta-N-acetylglucosaminyltransferase [Ruminococcus sp.]|uniref:undecaprenyldiphospho-muramoylpentapeptide beta-N-acetylglucosaminyltransferase n=1 Tax=Ruminococcus sp. TaxID=41978 RepID=UPI002E75F218|nr:undecaprenyldiphospho-muramoylpentapeptide beta-N-acetylglucosaminyltransferase [Ruminococcus sp.]MEE1261681.1 undecaprenyldiphospho-muramoylpentapeptide beta-N-acetylglucosaminyltransferase [Ruminococcus sp.]
MKVLLAGGGTAGHINPALAIAGYIKSMRPDTRFLFIGNEGGMEQRLVPQAGYDIKSISISGFKRSFKPKAAVENIKTLGRTVSSSAQAKKIIKEFNPDICIGTGGYVSGPVVRTAAKMGIPCLIHEQNAYPGVTNKLLSKRVKKIMLAVEAAKKYFPEADVVVTGNPVRGEILTADREASREKLGLDQRPVVLSFGGSLGAQKVNEAVADIVARSGIDGRYQHIHAYGKFGSFFPKLVEEKGADLSKAPNLDIRPYIDNMPECMAAADLVICRAGAITLSELQAMGKPAILIPSPNVSENHQYHNAMALVNAGAAELIEESELTGELLTKKIDEMLSDREKLRKYGECAKRMAITNAGERIYAIVKKTLESAK